MSCLLRKALTVLPTGPSLFKFSIFAPMLIVSKRIHHEVKSVLKILCHYYFQLIRSAIKLERVAGKDSIFLDICSRSRFCLEQ